MHDRNKDKRRGKKTASNNLTNRFKLENQTTIII